MGKRKRVQQAAAIPLLLASIVAVTEQQATPWFSISDQNGATEKLEAWNKRNAYRNLAENIQN